MARHTIPRNEYGQFAGDNVDAIHKKCEELAEELYSSFPDVDIFDLRSIASSMFNGIGSWTLVHEAGKNMEEKKDDKVSQ